MPFGRKLLPVAAVGAIGYVVLARRAAQVVVDIDSSVSLGSGFQYFLAHPVQALETVRSGFPPAAVFIPDPQGPLGSGPPQSFTFPVP